MNQFLEPIIVNKFPDCVAVKLHFNKNEKTHLLSRLFQYFIYIFSHNRNSSVSSQYINLSLTINFSGEQKIEIPAKYHLLPRGNATFGIKRGKLQFELTHCKIPLEKVELYAPFKFFVEIETQEEKGNERQTGLSLGATLSEKPNATATGTIGNKKADKIIEKVKVEQSQIQKTGSEEAPAWIFEVIRKESILEGSLREEKIGLIWIETKPCIVNATFKVEDKDIVLTGGKYGWKKDLTRNQLAGITTAIVRKYISKQLEPYLSEIKWKHE